MAKAIKFKLCRVVCQYHRILCNGVTINDRCRMLRLRKISRTDFKHYSFFFFSPLWKYPSPSYVYLETDTFGTPATFLKPSQNPSSFNLFFKFTLCLNNTSFENTAHRLFWFLIKIIGYNIGTCFKTSFPTALTPEYKKGLTIRKSSVKKDPIPLPSAPWK